MSCKYCTEYEDLPEHIIDGKPVGKVFDTSISENEKGWHIELPSGYDIGTNFCPICGRKLTRDARICTNNFIKSETVKEFASILKNKIKTECNPYGKPIFDYDTSIAIMHYIDKLVSDEVWRNW